MLRCEVCKKPFLRASTGKPARYCSPVCRSRGYYLDHKAKDHKPRRKGRAKRTGGVHRPGYYEEYNRRPEVMARNRDRKRSEYRPHPRKTARRATQISEPTPSPYLGHQWLEMARSAVGDFRPDSQWADDKWDEVGEALLALLEGKDPKDGVREYRKREYVPRYRTIHIGDWAGGDEAYAQARFDAMMPTSPSAEEEVVAKESVLRKTRYHSGDNLTKGRGQQRQQQPSRRRMKDAGWRKNIGV